MNILSLDLALVYLAGMVTLATTNGNINRYVVDLEITIKDQRGVAMLLWRRVWCVSCPGLSLDNTRCSAMFVRQTYSGTVPDGQGILYVGVKNDGVCGAMPDTNPYIYIFFSPQ